MITRKINDEQDKDGRETGLYSAALTCAELGFAKVRVK